MDHAITVGDVFWPALVILVGLAVVGGLIWLLSVFAEGFRH